VRELPDGSWLAPGFIDVQVNGGGDVLFNDAPTPAGIARIVAAHRRFGTTGLLPTLISDSARKMREASLAVSAAAQVCPGVLGIHFEGPFLSPERAGVHDPAMFRPSAPDDLDLLCARRGAATGVCNSRRAGRQPPAHNSPVADGEPAAGLCGRLQRNSGRSLEQQPVAESVARQFDGGSVPVDQ